MVVNDQGRILGHYPYFDSTFVQSKGLKKLEGKYVIIAPGHSLKQTEFVKGFEFDQHGRIIREYENYPDDGTSDTTEVLYSYNEKGKLSRIAIKESTGYRIHTFYYDSLSRICKEGYGWSKDPNAMENQVESLAYINFENQIRRKRSNNEGCVYKEEWFYYEDSLLVKIKDRFKMSSSNLETDFEYNESDQLISKRLYRTKDGLELEYHEYDYEEKGLSAVRKIDDGLIILDVQLIYTKEGVLASIIEEDSGTNAMRIVRFKNVEKWP